MSIFQRILAWIRGLSDTKAPDLGTDKPSSDRIDPKQNETTKTPIMLNTITLSSDMETLYLVDNNRAIEFPLNVKEGTLIGTLNGQITVVSAINPPKEENDPIGTGDNFSSPAGNLAKAKGGVLNPKNVVVSAKKGQWTAFFNGKLRILCLIGFGDIDVSIADTDKLEPQFFVFDLGNKVVNVRKRENAIVFTTIDRD
ncbi:MAG: hypothetical protein MRY78_18460 [Saprospiraceae bacterium]|nr:hypothetical protein [Saprospiraceae bacterium]